MLLELLVPSTKLGGKAAFESDVAHRIQAHLSMKADVAHSVRHQLCAWHASLQWSLHMPEQRW